MNFFSLIRNRFRSSGTAGLLGLELRQEGVAWALRSGKGVLTAGFAPGSVVDREGVLQRLVREQNLSGVELTLVLTPDLYQVFQLEKPPVEEAELRDALRWKVKDLLDFPLEDAVLDVFAYPVDATRGRGALLNVVVSRKSQLQPLIGLCLRAGLNLQRIDIAELAMSALLFNVAQGQRTAALVYLRPGLSQMVLCRGNVLYLSRRVDFSAEQLADVRHQDNSVQSLALELQRSLDYFESQLGQISPRQVTLVAQDVRVPLAAMLASNLAAAVVDLDGSLLLGDGALLDPKAACALGCILPVEVAG